jgi:starch synthase (maltosyl-transferring)
LITIVNRLRRENPALHRNESLRFHGFENDHIIAYSKKTSDPTNFILVLVNLDSHHVQSGWTNLALEEFGIHEQATYQVHDLLTEERYLWQGRRNYVELDPAKMPAHVFRIRREIRSEKDLENFA